MSGNYLKTIPIMIVTLVIGFIMVTAAVIPLAADYSEAKTFTNEGYYRMSEKSEETVITWTPSVDPFKVSVNGVDVSLNSLKEHGYSSYSIAFSNDFILRYYYQSASVQNLQIWAGDYQSGIGSSSPYTATITINNTGASFATNAEGNTPVNVTHSGNHFVIDDNGDYIMKLRDKGAYVLEDSSIVYAGGISEINTNSFTGLYFEGTLNDYTFTPMRSTVTVTDPDSTYTEIKGYIGLVSLDKITFNSVFTPLSGDPVEKGQTYSYFLVPYKISAEPDNPDTFKNLIRIVPLISIVALVAMAAGMLYLKGKE